MKTSVLRCFVVVVLLTAGFVVKAQEPFYNTKWEEGKMVSKTKYVMGYSGFYEQESISQFTYDAKGDFLKKEVYVWNRKYKWNDQANRLYPDYSESNWTPQYCILRNKDFTNNFVSMELLLWNNAKKSYDRPVERMVYQLHDSPNLFTYLAFQKGNRYVEWVNSVYREGRLLAEGVKFFF
jgi:hypothetical protein